MKQIQIALMGLIILAFVLSFFVRLIWVYQFNDYEAFKYAGQFMINTNDGYYWAEGARDLLNNSFQKNDLSPIAEAPSQLTYLLASLLPVSFETLIFYMPAFLGSLIVIPMILIGQNLKLPEVGFLAALLASIDVSYYNRTMVGYYDTDMLNIVLPVFLLWSLILAIRTQEEKYLLITALEIIAYRWWYPQSYSLEFSYFGLILFYAVLFDRKNIFNFKLLAIMMFTMVGLPTIWRLVLVGVVYSIFKQEKFQNQIMGKRNASAQAGLYTGQIQQLELICPNLGLQNQFAERIQLIEAQKQQAQSTLQKAEELFNSLLYLGFAR